MRALLMALVLLAAACASTAYQSPFPVVPMTKEEMSFAFRAIPGPNTDCKSGYKCPESAGAFAVCCPGGNSCCPNQCHVYTDGKLACDVGEGNSFTQIDITNREKVLANINKDLQSAMKDSRDGSFEGVKAQKKSQQDQNDRLKNSQKELDSLKAELKACSEKKPEPVPGSSAQLAQASCNHLLKSGAKYSGIYWVKPDANSQAFQAYCDMDTDGGGWQLIHKTTSRNNDDVTDSGANVDELLSVASDGGRSSAVLPRAMLRILDGDLTSEFQFRVTEGKASGWRVTYRGLPYYTTDKHDTRAQSPVIRLQPTSSWQPLQMGYYGGHSICFGIRIDWESEHVCIKRFAPSPYKGFWFNGNAWHNAHYLPSYGTGWVRIPNV